MTEASLIQEWERAVRPEDTVESLRSPLRQLVETIAPASLAGFDIVYEGAAIDIVGEIVNGTARNREIGGEQSAGIREHVAVTVLAFAINIAASLSVERFHAHHPDAWRWLIANEAPVSDKSGDRFEDILRRSGLSQSDQKHIRAELAKRPELLKLILRGHHK